MKMTTLLALKEDDIFELFEYIEKFAPEGMDKKEFALSQIGKFFVDLPIEKEIELYSIMESHDILDMHNFIKDNPLLKVNLDGDSPLDGKRAVRAKELSLKMSYIEAKKALASHNESKLARFIVDANELDALKEHKLYSYDFEKMNILKVLTDDAAAKIEVFEKELKDTIDIETFLSLVFEYGRRHKTNQFINYVFYHLDIIVSTLDDLSDDSKNYISKITEIVDNFNAKNEQ